MKRVLLAVMFGIGILSFAQDSEEKTKEIIKEQIVDKIKNYKPIDLAPYSKDGKKWALMDVKSRKILTDFILDEPSTFNPDIFISIDSEKFYGIKISWDYIVSLMPRYSGDEGMPVSMWIERTNEPGFKIKNGSVVSHYLKYKYINPILYKGEYYAIISSEEKEGRMLINPKGEEQEGFHFKYFTKTYYKDKESGETIFYVEDFEGKKGFITISGKRKLYGELMNDANTSLEYSIQKDGKNIDEIKKSGVVDLVTQKWLIKPQKKYKIYDIKYVAPEKTTDRAASIIYFLAKDRSGQHFVLDIKGKPILPKK